MKPEQYNSSLPHGLEGQTYLLALCYGLADPWTPQLGIFENYSVLPDGALNTEGLTLLAQARAAGWDHRNFYYYKRLDINWMMLESLINLIEFTDVTPTSIPSLAQVISDYILRKNSANAQ